MSKAPPKPVTDFNGWPAAMPAAPDRNSLYRHAADQALEDMAKGCGYLRDDVQTKRETFASEGIDGCGYHADRLARIIKRIEQLHDTARFLVAVVDQTMKVRGIGGIGPYAKDDVLWQRRMHQHILADVAAGNVPIPKWTLTDAKKRLAAALPA